MNYAIIETGGKQYKTSVGDILEIDKLGINPGDSYEFEKVLLLCTDGSSDIGRPFVENVTVVGKILDNIKGPKIRVAKFKAKARYRKVRGFRQHLTRVQITDIKTKTTAKSQKTKVETGKPKDDKKVAEIKS